MALDFARAQRYEPGANVKGGELAAWLFLLPSLDLDRLVVVGARMDPTARAIATLARSTEVGREVSSTAETAALVYVTGRAARRVARSPDAVTTLRRCVEQGGVVVIAASAQSASAAAIVAQLPGSAAVAVGSAGRPAAPPAAAVDGAAWFLPAESSVALGGRWRRRLRRLLRRGTPPRLLAVREVSRATTTVRRRQLVIVRGDRHVPTSLPHYLAESARAAGHELGGERWILEPSRGYRSQKLVFHLPAAGEIVKVTQDPAFNARLDNEYSALLALDAGRREDLAPRPRFRAEHAGLLVIGQSRLVGDPFRSRSTSMPTCPVAERVIDALTELSQLATAAPTPAEAAAALHELLRQHVRVHGPSAEHVRILARQIDAIGAAPALPAVFSHGDATTLNILVGPDDQIGLVDWENAEPHGLPLWDVFHFVNAYAQWHAERRGARWDAAAIHGALYEPGEFATFLGRSVDRYAAAVGVPRELVVPLLLTFWMALALRESTRTTARRAPRAPYAELLARLVRNVSTIKLHGGTTG
jgi:hypothetical protein